NLGSPAPGKVWGKARLRTCWRTAMTAAGSRLTTCLVLAAVLSVVAGYSGWIVEAGAPPRERWIRAVASLSRPARVRRNASAIVGVGVVSRMQRSPCGGMSIGRPGDDHGGRSAGFSGRGDAAEEQ